MFIQVISGKVTDVGALEALQEKWDRDLRPGAVGFLGVTAGVTDDGRFVTMARFESQEAAQKNSDRPEQGAWWSELEHLTSDVTVHDCSRVQTMFGGGKDGAGFVQVMCGRVKDRDKADAMFEHVSDAEQMLSKARPDVIGEVIAVHDDGDTYTDVVYFSSEAEARANESKPMPDEAQAMMAEMDAAIEVTDYLDLHHLVLR